MNMALSDSMFLFEIIIKDLKSYKDFKDYRVMGNFENIFQFNINNPNKDHTRDSKKTRVKQITKVRITKSVTKKQLAPIKAHIGETILIISRPCTLVSKMKEYPLEVFICRKGDPDLKVASTRIPWSTLFIKYLSHLKKKPDMLSPVVERSYNLYDENTSKRIATIEMSMKLTYLSDKVTSRFRALSEDKDSTFLNTQINSKPISILSKVRESIEDNQSKNHELKKQFLAKCLNEHHRYEISKVNDSEAKQVYKKNDEISSIVKIKEPKTDFNMNKNNSFSLKMIKSEPEIVCNKQKSPHRSKSYSSMSCTKETNVFQYIFGNPNCQLEKIYHVGYFTVENVDSDPDSVKTSSEHRSSTQSSPPSSKKEKFHFMKCDSKCQSNMDTPGLCSESVYSTDLPEEASHLITVTKCKQIDCDYKKFRELPSPPDKRILLDVKNRNTPCITGIEVENNIEEVVGGVSAKIKIGEEPCFCTCECTFGFTKKTTYCNVCGGYETVGEDLSRKTAQEMPMPCPIFHKLVDKNKLKTYSTSGSESKKKGDDQKSLKAGSSQRAALEKKQISDKKDVESEKDSRKGKKKKRDDRFKFNYGYKAPHIGHSKCALPCTGTLSNVPRKMGWLWTSEDIPGMKFRPMWKPGATNKHVVRMLKIARNPGGMISKKKRKDTGKKKRPLKRPLLVVHKKDGEYTVTMETMKSYNRPRALNQQPYEDKPVVTYTVGRTEEENRDRLKKKEREQRRLERAQRDFIQSAFKDMCHEICLKTYQQALGILPDTEDPPCTCYPAVPTPKTTNMDVSCSCSEDSASIGSDTDSDEWIIEFTPPNATFDPTYKGKKVLKSDNSSQYSYLDYRVKLLDRYGNPVPRFFKGPDGKKQCSDLGGFWSPDHKWLKINIEGYIGPDGRWAPNIFIGPNGEQVDGETGKFQATNGKWLVVGVDGFVDSKGKWRNYSKPPEATKRPRRVVKIKKGKPGENKNDYKSEASWSCFGDVSPRILSKLGIVGHGGDRKLLNSTLQDMLARGEDVQLPQPTTVFHLPSSKKSKKGQQRVSTRRLHNFNEQIKCRHPTPSDKGILGVDARGNKTYFRLTDAKNKRPKDRLDTLVNQGISLSSFHVPCFHSFINSGVMKQQQRERLLALSKKTMSTQVS